MTYTYTYTTLEVSNDAYDEIERRIRQAGNDDAINDAGEIDMHGIALVRFTPNPVVVRVKYALLGVLIILAAIAEWYLPK